MILKYIIRLAVTFTGLVLVACGGGGGSSTDTGGGNNEPTYTAGVFQNESLFKDRCESPRTFNDIDGNPLLHG